MGRGGDKPSRPEALGVASMPSIAELLQAADGHRRAGRLAEAKAGYEEVLRHAPDSPAVLNNLGTLLLLQGDPAGARPLLEKAVRLQPDYALAHNNLGTVWLTLGEFTLARACFAQALAHQPRFAQAQYNLGTVLHREGRLDEAEAALRRALELDPAYAPAHYQRGVVLKDLFRLDEAQDALQRALALERGFVDAWSVLAHVHALQGKMARARSAIDRARALEPAGALQVRAALLLPVIYESVEEVERERTRLEESLTRLSNEDPTIVNPAESVGATAFYLAYQGRNDRALLERLAAVYRRAAPELSFVAPHCRTAGLPLAAGRPIRVGFLSAFFYRHTIGKLNLGLIRNLSRAQFAVTLLRFPAPYDDLARALEVSADQVVTLPRHLEAARRQLAALELDVLYYADIGMDPLTYFLAFARLAPVQCVAWGHPVTSGIATIDYFLSSALLEPDDAAAHYTEELVPFPQINTYYYEPTIRGRVKPRGALGLVPSGNLYVCAQSLFKIHPGFDAVLGAILRGDPGGRVVLIEGPCAHWKELLLDRLRRTIPAEAAQIVFLPRMSQDDFLHLQARATVLLDTLHFGGGSTSFEALALGTPIVTGAGRALRDRITAACYRQMGITECIAESEEEYVRIALRLGTDAEFREEMRGLIRERKHRLYEDAQAVRQLEEFLVAAVEQARAGTGAINRER
jgi:predicted O-linked N-acetylglucosamine transferase (SPINDLY family)